MENRLSPQPGQILGVGEPLNGASPLIPGSMVHLVSDKTGLNKNLRWLLFSLLGYHRKQVWTTKFCGYTKNNHTMCHKISEKTQPIFWKENHG